MRCPTLDELPSPPPSKSGWPWMEISPPPASGDWPKASIVTPSLNQGKFLEETIRSVLLQNYPNLEYFVIDGGSTDGSVEIIRKYAAWLTYWISEPDQGQSDAINKGWRRSTGKFVGYMNADDTFCPGAIATAVEALSRDADTALVHGNCHIIDGQSRLLRKRIVHDVQLADILGWSPSIAFPGALIRRSVLDSVGFLDANLHYVMDYELSLRIGLNHKIQFVPHTLANLREQPDAKTAIGPTQHVLEGIGVAEKFFVQSLPPHVAALKQQTLASLWIRKARLDSRAGQATQGRRLIRQALHLSLRPNILKKAAIAYLMSFLSTTSIDRLRRWKRTWLRAWLHRFPIFHKR